eukprot:gene2705-3356_t
MYKYLLLTILVICSSIGLVYSQQPSDAQLYAAFENWMINYNVYYTSGDKPAKFKAWKENILKVAEYNSKLQTADILLEYPEDAGRDIEEVQPTVSYPSSEISQLSANKYTDLTYTEFVETMTGADSSLAPAVATAAVLSTGAIVGIAIGGAAAVGGATAGGIALKKHLNKKKTREVELEKKPEISNPTPTGTNIFNLQNPHHSITARAFTGTQ